MNSKYDFYITMEDICGNAAIVYGYDQGKAYLEIEDYAIGENVTIECKNEQEAYNIAYKRGYRE